MPSLFATLARVALFGIGVIFAAAAAFMFVRLGEYTHLGRFIVVGAPAGAAIALGYSAMRLRGTAATRIARELIMVGASLLVVEFLIAAVAPDNPSRQMERMRTAHRLGIPFDSRTKSMVIEQLREQGEEVLPGISRDWPLLAPIRQQLPGDLYPLSDVSRAKVVECNEGGRYVFLQTDEFGFNNPPGLLASRNVEILVVGESFAVGHCVPPEQNLVAVIRRAHPRTVNLGMAGSNSLSMLGSFREYAEPLKPPLVLWIMNPNTTDPWREYKDSLLPQYLEPGFTQHLIDRQADIDRAWREIAIPAQYEFDRRSLIDIRAATITRFSHIPLLTRLRERLRLDAPLERPSDLLDLSLFLRIVRLAHDTTQKWGGEFIVVIMPLYEDVVVRQLPPSQRHENIAIELRKAGVEVIDAASLFARQADPPSLYTLRINNHPSAAGHALLGSYILDELARRGAQRLAAKH
jgi:hypothetical protein